MNKSPQKFGFSPGTEDPAKLKREGERIVEKTAKLLREEEWTQKASAKDHRNKECDSYDPSAKSGA